MGWYEEGKGEVWRIEIFAHWRINRVVSRQQQYIIYIVWQVVYRITCYIDIYENFMMKMAERFLDKVVNLKEDEFFNQ